MKFVWENFSKSSLLVLKTTKGNAKLSDKDKFSKAS
jgi:hypothetical protein